MERPRAPLPRAAADPDRLVAIAGFASPVEAHLALARLRAEGLSGSLTGEHAAGLGVGSVVLWVRSGERDRALALVRPTTAPGSRRSALFVSADLDAPRCPHCGSVAVEPDRLERGLRPVVWLLSELGLAPAGRRARCRPCGGTWRED